MAEGMSRERWAHTSVLCALIANVNRDPKRMRAFKPSDFDPYAEHNDRIIVNDKETWNLLKQAFTGKK